MYPKSKKVLDDFLKSIDRYIVASELKDPIWHSSEWQIGSFSSEATILWVAVSFTGEDVVSTLNRIENNHLLTCFFRRSDRP